MVPLDGPCTCGYVPEGEKEPLMFIVNAEDMSEFTEAMTRQFHVLDGLHMNVILNDGADHASSVSPRQRASRAQRQSR